LSATTIQVKTETLERLKALKQYERETYETIINRLIDASEEGELSDEAIEGIKRGLDDIKAGRTGPIEKVAEELNIELE